MKLISTYVYLVFKFVLVGLKSAWQYRVSFLIEVLIMFLNDVLLVFIWVIFFTKFKSINGWEFKNTLMLFSTFLFAFSFAIIFFPGVLRIAEKISNGKVDVFLTQPKSVLFRMLTDDFRLSLFGDFLFGVVILFYVASQYGYSNLFFIPLTGLFSAWGIVVTAGSFALFGFWISKFHSAANNFFWTLDAPAMYPQNSIVGGIRVLFFTVAPSLWYISFSYEFVSRHAFNMLGVVILYDVVMTLFMVIVYRLGIKKYESGNAILTND